MNELIKTLIHEAMRFRGELVGSRKHAYYQIAANALGAAINARAGKHFLTLATFGGNNLYVAGKLLDYFAEYDGSTRPGRALLEINLVCMKDEALDAMLDSVTKELHG